MRNSNPTDVSCETHVIWLVFAGAFASAGILILAVRGLSPLYSGESLVRDLPPELRTVPAYAIRHYDQTLPFYLRHTTTLVEERNELDFGLRLEPWRAIENLAEFKASWLKLPQALAVLEDTDLEELQRRGVPLRIRARAGREVLISRH